MEAWARDAGWELDTSPATENDAKETWWRHGGTFKLKRERDLFDELSTKLPIGGDNSTPRTNSQRHKPIWNLASMVRIDKGEWVPASFSRQLELELNAAMVVINSASHAAALHCIANMRDALKLTRNELSDALDCLIDRGITDDTSDGYKDGKFALERANDVLCITVEGVADEIKRLRAECDRLRKNEEICHCGEPISAHHFGSGHSPVPMLESCPYAEELNAIRSRHKS